MFVTLLTSNRDLMTSLTQPQNEPDWAAGTCFISERCIFGTVVCIVRSSIKGTRGWRDSCNLPDISLQLGEVLVNTLAELIANANKYAHVQCALTHWQLFQLWVLKRSIKGYCNKIVRDLRTRRKYFYQQTSKAKQVSSLPPNASPAKESTMKSLFLRRPGKTRQRIKSTNLQNKKEKIHVKTITNFHTYNLLGQSQKLSYPDIREISQSYVLALSMHVMTTAPTQHCDWVITASCCWVEGTCVILKWTSLERNQFSSLLPCSL